MQAYGKRRQTARCGARISIAPMGGAAGCEVMIVDARQCRICPIFASTKSHTELSPDHQGNLPNALTARPKSAPASTPVLLASQFVWR